MAPTDRARGLDSLSADVEPPPDGRRNSVASDRAHILPLPSSPERYSRYDPAPSEDSDSDVQPSPRRFSRKARRLPSSDEEDHASTGRPWQGARSVSPADDDGNHDGFEESINSVVDGNSADIEFSRRKLRNEEIEEVKEMFRDFMENKLKPCSSRLGRSVSQLMKIGNWELSTPERRHGSNAWNAFLKDLKGLCYLILPNTYLYLHNVAP